MTLFLWTKWIQPKHKNVCVRKAQPKWTIDRKTVEAAYLICLFWKTTFYVIFVSIIENKLFPVLTLIFYFALLYFLIRPHFILSWLRTVQCTLCFMYFTCIFAHHSSFSLCSVPFFVCTKPLSMCNFHF